MNSMVTACVLAAWLLSGGAGQAQSPQAQTILEAAGVTGGLIVHVGCGDGKLTAALRANDSYIVQGLDADVTAARQYIQSLGVYGSVSAGRWTGGRLPYTDNIVMRVCVPCRSA